MKKNNNLKCYTVPLALGLGLVLTPNNAHADDTLILSNEVVTSDTTQVDESKVTSESSNGASEQTTDQEPAFAIDNTELKEDLVDTNNQLPENENSILPSDEKSLDTQNEADKNIEYLNSVIDNKNESDENLSDTSQAQSDANADSTNNLETRNISVFALSPAANTDNSTTPSENINTDLKDYTDIQKREKVYDDPNEGLKYGNIQYKSYDSENKELNLVTEVYASRKPGDWNKSNNDPDAGTINLTFRNPDFASKIEKIVITGNNGQEHEFTAEEANKANWQFNIDNLGNIEGNTEYTYPVKIKLKEDVADNDKNTLMEMVWINKDSKYDPYSKATTTFDDSGFDTSKPTTDKNEWVNESNPVVGRVIYDKGNNSFKTIHALTPNKDLSDPSFENSTIYLTDYVPKELVPYLDNNVKAYRSIYNGDIEPENNNKVYNIALNEDGSASTKSNPIIGKSAEIDVSRNELNLKSESDLGLLHADTIAGKTYPVEYTFEYKIKDESLAAFNNELRKLTSAGKANVYSEQEIITKESKENGEGASVINNSRHFMAFPIIKQKEILDSGFIKFSDDGKRLNTIYEVINDRTGEKHIIATDENGKYVFKNTEEIDSNKLNQNDKFIDSSDLLYYAGFIPNNPIEFNDLKENDTFTINELRSESNLNHNLESFKYKLETPEGKDYQIRTFTDAEGNPLNIANTEEIENIDKQIDKLKEKQNQVKRLRDLYNLLNLDVVKEGMMPINVYEFENKWLSTIYEQNVSKDRLKMYQGALGKEIEEIDLKKEPSENYYDDVTYAPYSEFIDYTYPDFQNYLSDEKDTYGVFQLTTTDSEDNNEVIEFIVYYPQQYVYDEVSGSWQEYQNQVPKNIDNLKGLYEGENKTISLVIPLEEYQNFSPDYKSIMLNMLNRPDDNRDNYEDSDLRQELGKSDITQDQLSKFIRKDTLEGLSNDYLLNIANNFSDFVKEGVKTTTDLAVNETNRIVKQPDKTIFLQAIDFIRSDFESNYDNLVNEYGRFEGTYKYFDTLNDRVNKALEEPIENYTGMNEDQYKQYIKKYLHKLLEEDSSTIGYSNALDDDAIWWGDYYGSPENGQTSDIVFGLYTKYHDEISNFLFKDPYQKEIDELEKSKVKLYKVVNEKMIFVTDTFDKADSDKEIYIGKSSEIYDKVSYDKFNVGSNYEFKGYIVDKQTGKVIKEFEPISHKITQQDVRNGEVTLKYVFDSSHYEDGDEFVIFYEVYENGKLVAVEEDINNAGQTFKVRKKNQPQPQPNHPIVVEESYIPWEELIPAKEIIPWVELTPAKEIIPWIELTPAKEVIGWIDLVPAEKINEIPLTPLIPAEKTTTTKESIPLVDLIPAQESTDSETDNNPEKIIVPSRASKNKTSIAMSSTVKSNPKTGITGLNSVFAILATSIAGLFKTKKRN